MLNDIYNDANSRMDQAVKHTQMELNKIRTGRANPELFNSIVVDYYGTATPLNQVSTISVPEPRLITLQPYEKTLIPVIEKAIMDGGETVDGKVSMKDITKALDEYERLHKAGIASPAELLTLSRAFPNNRKYTEALKKEKISDDDKLVIGGPASIELVDRDESAKGLDSGPFIEKRSTEEVEQQPQI